METFLTCASFLLCVLIHGHLTNEIGRICMTPHGLEGVCKPSTECDAHPITDEATKELIFCSDEKDPPIICCAPDNGFYAEIEAEKIWQRQQVVYDFLQLVSSINQPQEDKETGHDELLITEDGTPFTCNATDISHIINEDTLHNKDRHWKLLIKPQRKDSFVSLKALNNETFTEPECGSTVPLPEVFGSINGYLYPIYFLNWTLEYVDERGEYKTRVTSMYIDAVKKLKYWNKTFCGSVGLDDVFLSSVEKVEEKRTVGDIWKPEISALYTVLIGKVKSGKTEWFCSGVLISRQWVLSAAHCFIKKTEGKETVHLGDYDLSMTSEDRRQRRIFTIDVDMQVILSPGYKPPVQYHDLALLKLVQEIPLLTHNMNPICLPWNDIINNHLVEKLVFSGFGTELLHDLSHLSNLKVFKVTVFSPIYCGNGYSTTGKFDTQFPEGMTHDNVFCAANENQIDACRGDSGAPIAYELNGRITLAATISVGIGCGNINYPTVSVPINNQNYLMWIDREIWM